MPSDQNSPRSVNSWRTRRIGRPSPRPRANNSPRASQHLVPHLRRRRVRLPLSEGRPALPQPMASTLAQNWFYHLRCHLPRLIFLLVNPPKRESRRRKGQRHARSRKQIGNDENLRQTRRHSGRQIRKPRQTLGSHRSHPTRSADGVGSRSSHMPVARDIPAPNVEQWHSRRRSESPPIRCGGLRIEIR